MKLLIDEMYPALVAHRLREEYGADVVSVLERSDLRGQPDGDIFQAAQQEGRMIVTENVPDYLSLGRTYQSSGGLHHGLVLTTNRRFPRARKDTMSRLFKRLADMLAEEDIESPPSNREVWL